ncbi:MAG: MAPEG family protein [Candidatus Binatia bacterium]|nr:MAPEG family protein [Candidatus Binatia bacterium]
MEASSILQPVFVVGLLTVVMTVWMIATRVPAMTARGIDAQEAQNTARIHDLLPPEITRISNNYNHLFEQPTLFYAVALSIAVLGHVDTMHVGCAWLYAALRITHSLVQATVDIVMVRFGLFVLSWIALATMIIRETIAVF